MIRLAQLTDLHLPDTPRLKDYGGGVTIDPRRNFLRALDAVRTYQPDYLVLSGDLAMNDGEPGAYAWLAQHIADAGLSTLYMSGNHDRLDNMRQMLGIPDTDVLDGDFLCYARDFPQGRLLFLDTTPYTLAARQLEWLVQQAEDGRPLLLFMHHPPLYCGSRFMDERHGLRNLADVWPVLASLDNLQHIFCGHYHTGRSLDIDGKGVHLTPSTLAQIDALTPDFHIADTRPAWRRIEWDGTRLNTQVYYP